MADLLVKAFTTLLQVKRMVIEEIQVSWLRAKADLERFTVDGVCGCEYAFDDHGEDEDGDLICEGHWDDGGHWIEDIPSGAFLEDEEEE